MQLTQREFLFLEDLLHAEQLEMVKFQDFAQHCQDPQLQEMCSRIANHHHQHFNKVLNILDQSQGGQTGYQNTGKQQLNPNQTGGLPQ